MRPNGSMTIPVGRLQPVGLERALDGARRVVAREAALPGVGHEHAVRRADGEIRLGVEVLPAEDRELAHERAVGLEDLDAVVARVGDVDAAGGVGGEADGLDELAGLVAGAAPGRRDLARPRRSGRSACCRCPRRTRKPFARDDRARTEEARIAGAPLAEPLPVGREARDAVVPGVRDVDVPVGADRDAAGLVELAVARALRRRARAGSRRCRRRPRCGCSWCRRRRGCRWASAATPRGSVNCPGPRRGAEDARRPAARSPRRGSPARRCPGRRSGAARACPLPREVLADEDGRVLRADRAPDLVEEPPADEVLERRADASSRPPSAAPGTTRRGSGRASRRSWARAASRARPRGPSRRR